MIRVAAIGDTHCAEDMRGLFRPLWERLAEDADVLLLAGDLGADDLPRKFENVARAAR